MEALNSIEYNEAVEALDDEHQIVTESPTPIQKLHGFTVVCLVLNRTIGSGIFVTPSRILMGTGSVGTSLLFWAAGAVIATCGLLVWLELGLTLPLSIPPGGIEKKSVPRSGGEFNYISWMFPRPKFLAICMYGIVFVLLGNLSGNAIAFGTYIMVAANRTNPSHGQILALAIGALTLAVAIHIFSRKGGIFLNNAFAVLKVAILLAVFVLGMVKVGGHRLGGDPPATSNFHPKSSFVSQRKDVASYVDSLLYVFYSYSGFQQPFYVLAEVSQPRRVFPKYTLIAMGITTFLFIGVNVAFFSVVPKDVQFEKPGSDMATLFFARTFGTDVAERVMAAVIAFSIFGNILVMTFTASRVKQEIAKEGILPFSLYFATSSDSLVASISSLWRKTCSPSEDEKFLHHVTEDSVLDHSEQTPIAGLLLHWVTSLLLIAVTVALTPSTAYSALVTLYSYVIVVGMGMVCSFGLLLQYLNSFSKDRKRLNRANEWSWIEHANFKPFPYPIHAVIYFLVSTFLIIAAIVARPGEGSPFSYKGLHIAWYVVPAIGLSTPLWGCIWWLGLHVVMKFRRRTLVVTRAPFIVPDDEDPGQFVQLSELVDQEWLSSVPVVRRSPAASLDERY